ncbi:zinc ribbon domain-containing protein [bacterium]|nr:zinc ribbon domain-containing protein [Rubripirellula sp.]MDA7864966.1 zinc ribbon domain-containing protein [bacterium]MDB4644721.1 zinc ribbon domain-containing protein [Rubripirellula sp.]
MPLYEFECKSCDSIVEMLVRSTQETSCCPDCGTTELKRLLSVPSSPSIKSKSDLPVAGAGDSCGAPRCCGGSC